MRKSIDGKGTLATVAVGPVYLSTATNPGALDVPLINITNFLVSLLGSIF